MAEALGTALLIIAVIGSGIMASWLSPNDVGLELLENAAATARALIGLILMFGAVSGAHFNPGVTLVDRLLGTTTSRDTVLYAIAQTIGGCIGAVVANLMFSLPAVRLSSHTRSSGALWLSEVVATVGLLLVIHGCVRTGRAAAVPFAVGVWIAGRHRGPHAVGHVRRDQALVAPMFIVMQIIGALIAYGLIRFIYPHNASEAER